MDRPVLKAGFLSRWLFLWVDVIMRRAYRSQIESKDFYRVSEDDSSSNLCDRLEREWIREIKSNRPGKDPGYHIALLRCFKWQIAITAGLTVLKDAARMAQPFILARILQYFETSEVNADNQISTKEAYLSTLALAIAAIAVPMLHHPIYHSYGMIGIRMRIASSALIYRKVLRLSSKSLFVTTTGHVVNLISNDVAKLEDVLVSCNYIWWGPVQAVVILIMLWKKIGAASLVGLALSLLLTVVLLAIGKVLNRLRLRAATQSDERIRLMDQIVCGMKVIKMYCWEKSFARLVETVRSREMSVLSTSKLIRLIASEFGSFTFSAAGTALCIITYILLHGKMMSLETVLTVKWLLYLVEENLCFAFGEAVAYFSVGLATCRRIKDFLLLSEFQSVEVYPSLSKDDIHVVLSDFTGTWKTDSDNATLRAINLNAKPADLIAVIGPVGSGKSSLLMAILGELPPTSGTISARGRIAYAAQQPWIFSASVKDNILFGSDFDQTKYRSIVQACALLEDFESLPQGDETLVGERGVILSGGQRARVGLARAVYRDADIYLLDDPLSAVDTVVAEHLFNCCINGLLKDRIRIVVTHQLRFTLSATQIIWLVEGQVQASGCYTDLATCGLPTDMLRFNESKELSSSLLPTSYRLAPRSKSEPAMAAACNEAWTAETQGLQCTWGSMWHADAATASQVAGDAHCQGRSFCRVSLCKPVPEKIPHTTFDKEERGNDVSAETCLLTTERGPQTTTGEVGIAVEPEQVQSGAVSWRWYWQYFRSGGNAFALIGAASVIAGAQVGFLVFDWYVTTWAYTEDKYQHAQSDNVSKFLNSDSSTLTAGDHLRYAATNVTNKVTFSGNISFGSESPAIGYDAAQRVTWTWIFGALSAAVAVVSFLRVIVWSKLSSRASTAIHNRMFMSLVQSCMRFFDTNPAGRILNRFSRDVGTIDDQLSLGFYETLTVAIKVVAIILLSVAVNPLALLPLLPLIAALSLLLRLYTPSSRAVKRLESVARSPVFSQLSTTLAGLQSVRAYREQDASIRQFDDCQNSHTEAYFMYTAMSRWLGVRLDWICSIFISCVIFLFLAARDSLNANPSLFGLTINNILLLTSVFQVAIRYMGVVEIYMTSVERCAEYMELTPEELHKPSVLPPKGWPNCGVIEALGVSLKYAEGEPEALKNLAFRIEGGEKIGICGRTGAGKSSLLSLLFRLCEPKGRVLIDGVCISEIPLKDLRSAISIIPQDPVLFSTTIRGNLDPFNEHDDDDLWSSLEQVQLAALIHELDGELEAPVSEGGANFSTGQRQLVCLARALLRRNKILVVDEATANVDLGTDAMVQKTIRKEFRDCTVLTIAHRLDTIVDSDRVMVLENGVITEFDAPHRLLQNPRSAFYTLVQHAGRVRKTEATGTCLPIEKK